MDSIDLIARENEFKKLNKQLEKKTESLMKEIEEVMQKPDIFSTPNLKFNPYNNKTSAGKHRCNISPSSTIETVSRNNSADHKKSKDIKRKNLKNVTNSNVGKESNLNKEVDLSSVSVNGGMDSKVPVEKVSFECCVKETVSDDLQFLYAFVSVSVKDNVLPQSYLKGNITVESVCKCLSAKVKLLQEQVDKLQSAIEKRNKQCEAHLTQIAELESERLTLLNTANTMKSDTADMKAKYLAVQNRLKEKERQYTEQRSAADKLSSELKRCRGRCAELEGRNAAQGDSLAGLRQRLDAAGLAEKEYRDSTRALIASHESTISRLEEKARALQTRMGRQRALVENLRAQCALLGAMKATEAMNVRYNRLLEGDES